MKIGEKVIYKYRNRETLYEGLIEDINNSDLYPIKVINKLTNARHLLLRKEIVNISKNKTKKEALCLLQKIK